MAYIFPNSTIILYDNVPLDPSYRNTLYFRSLVDQVAYFHSGGGYPNAHAIVELTAQSYQRQERNTCRIEVPIGTAYTANYMAFRNNSFEGKWFYAFITSVEYINHTVTQIEYEIDIMQTYLFDVELKPCFVEREHLSRANDTIGANILPEHFNLGEYRYENLKELKTGLTDYTIIVGITTDGPTDNLVHSIGKEYDGVFSGLALYAFTNPNDVVAFINAHITVIDNIVAMWMVPSLIVPPYDSGSHLIGSTARSISFANNLGDPITGTEDFDGYVPTNKKLYTYPYNYFEVVNGQGSSLVTRYEWFTDFTPRFHITGTMMQPVSLVCRPANYKGINNAGGSGGLGALRYDFNESIELTGYPICSWTYDSYQRWVSTRMPQVIRAGIVKTAMALPSVTGATIERFRNAEGQMTSFWRDVNTGRIDTTKNAIQKRNTLWGAKSLLSSAQKLYEESYEASLATDPVKGSLSSANPDFAAGLMTFWTHRSHISGEMARVVDNYFSVFGYQTNLVKIPNRDNRNYWNYVKTQGCVLEKVPAAKVSASDIADIEAIYDNGITFWHDPTMVNEYTDANMRNN